MKFLSDPLPPRVIEHPSSHRYILMNRVISFDPAEVYSRVQHLLNPHKRIQSNLSLVDLWPNSPGICGCGCGLPLVGRQTRWASKLCSEFPLEVYWIIRGDAAAIRPYIARYWGEQCCRCGKSRETLYGEIRERGEWKAPLYLDHIVPVKHGGGASWLGNYQLLCETCHRLKTNEDFGWKQTRLDMPDQLKLL